MPQAKKPDYPKITISFLPNQILVTIDRFEDLQVRRIQRSIREVYREYNILRKRLIHKTEHEARQPKTTEVMANE